MDGKAGRRQSLDRKEVREASGTGSSPQWARFGKTCPPSGRVKIRPTEAYAACQTGCKSTRLALSLCFCPCFGRKQDGQNRLAPKLMIESHAGTANLRFSPESIKLLRARPGGKTRWALPPPHYETLKLRKLR